MNSSHHIMPAKDLASALGVTEMTLQNWRTGVAFPSRVIGGFVIMSRDLAQWERPCSRQPAVNSDGQARQGRANWNSETGRAASRKAYTPVQLKGALVNGFMDEYARSGDACWKISGEGESRRLSAARRLPRAQGDAVGRVHEQQLGRRDRRNDRSAAREGSRSPGQSSDETDRGRRPRRAEDVG